MPPETMGRVGWHFERMSKSYSGSAGGFFAENSPSQFQSSPIKNRIGGTLSSQTLKPAVIKQLVEAQMTHPEAPYQVDGYDLTQITVVACLRQLKEQNNGSDYLLEDGTGTLCGHVWASNDKNGGEWMTNLKEGQWYRVYGQLKNSQNVRYLQINQMKAISSSDELTCHFLAVINLHLTNTNRATLAPSILATSATNSNFAELSPVQQAVREIYSQCKADTGLHINSVVQCLRSKYGENEIRNSVIWLLNEGYLYQTIDTDHAKSTD